MAKTPKAPKAAKAPKAPKTPKAPKAAKAEGSEPRSQGRKVISSMRAKLATMTSTQLKAFYVGFTAKELERHVKAMGNVKTKRVSAEIEATQKEIEALQTKLKSLKG